jgi:hypothetical protein
MPNAIERKDQSSSRMVSSELFHIPQSTFTSFELFISSSVVTDQVLCTAKRFTDGCHAAKQDIFSGESEPATKSMNRLVLDSFMTDMDKKQTRKKDAKVTKEAPNSTNSKAPAKPRTSRKRNADSQCDPDELAGPEKAEEEELMVLATTKRQRGGRSTRPVAFGKNGKAFYAIHVPTVDPGKIIRAPTNEEIQNNLLIQADEDFSFPENYHVYRDASSGLDFAIILVRLDIHNNTGGERIFLRLYESNTEPHTYAAHLRYASPQCANKDSNLAPLGSSFELAFEGYRNAFKDHTHVDWMYRIRACAKVGTGPKEAKKFVKADGTEVKEVPYFYVKVQPVE